MRNNEDNLDSRSFPQWEPCRFILAQITYSKLMRSLLSSVLTLHDEGPQLGGQLEVDGQPSLEDVLLHLQEELVSTNTTK